MLDPHDRITVDEALEHPYVHVWFDDQEVNGPTPDLGLLRDVGELYEF